MRILVRLLALLSVALPIPTVAQAADPVFSEEIIDSQSAGPFASIAVDGRGTPSVGYVDPVRRKLRYAHRTATGWSTEDVADSWSNDCQFTVSVYGQPFFVFGGYQSAVREPTGWRVLELSGCIGWSVGATALCAAPDGSVHMCTQESCSGGWYGGVINHAMWQQRWVESSVAERELGLSGTVSIAANTFTAPHISSWNNVTGNIDYYAKVGAAWVQETIGRSTVGYGHPISGNCIALDPAGVPYVAYFDAVEADLRLGVRQPQGWTTEVVDPDGDVGRSCSLGVGADGSVHIAYFDATHGNVKYAKRAPGTTQWSIRVLASDGVLAEQVDLALDVRGDVHVIFYDRARGTLLYATTRSRVAVQPTSLSRVRTRYR